MKTVEKVLTKKNLVSYETKGFIIREKVQDSLRNEIIKESRNLAEDYIKVDWKNIFSDSKIKERYGVNDLFLKNQDHIGHISICDPMLGVFSIQDMGENYIIFCNSSWDEDCKKYLLDKLNSCSGELQILNKNLINIKKERK